MDGTRGFASPLVTSYGAPASQQVMSPTQGTPALEHGTRVFSGSTPPFETGHSGAEGFEPMAVGRAFGGAGQHESLQNSGEAPRMSTTMEGGVGAHLLCQCPASRRAKAQGYRPTLTGQVQVPSMGVGMVKPREGEYAVEALRVPAQTAVAATSGFWSNLWSGLQGSEQLPSNAIPPEQSCVASMKFPPPERVGQRVADHSAQVPTSQVSQVHQAPGSGTQSAPVGGALPSVPASLTPGENHGIASGNPALDAVLLGVQQLQALQAQSLSGSKKADAPEQVKTGITAFPKLAPPNPAGGSLEFQDWLQLIAGLMGDFSDSSQLWWSGVVQVTKDAYERWVTSSPIERLRVEPDDRPEITEGKWGECQGLCHVDGCTGPRS